MQPRPGWLATHMDHPRPVSTALPGHPAFRLLGMAPDAGSARDTDWDGVRLHIVTGKGGTGKTTVAAALALALAHSGRKVLLIEAEGRQGIARLFDRPPLPYGERKIAIGPGEAEDGRGQGGDVYALAIDPEGALLDYLQ